MKTFVHCFVIQSITSLLFELVGISQLIIEFVWFFGVLLTVYLHISL